VGKPKVEEHEWLARLRGREDLNDHRRMVQNARDQKRSFREGEFS